MRVVACIGVTAVCLGLAGCTTPGKQPAPVPAPAFPAASRGAPAPADRTEIPTTLGGVLAGQVLDSFNHRPPPTYIQVTDLEAGASGTRAPIEVATDSQGYFTIQGLQAGRHYQLTARAREGNRMLAGTALATPPNPKLLIHISEDFATGGTPPLPQTTTWPGTKPAASIQPPAPAAAPPRADQTPLPVDPAWLPGREPAGSANPAPGRAPASPVAPAASRPENIAQDSADGRRPDPTTRIPPASAPTPSWQPGTRSPAPSPPTEETTLPPAGPARVPSCVLTGQMLYNFALNDLNGQPWEYRHDHRGRLVLLDFWTSPCLPCVHAMAHLKGWENRYRPYGLEVIGIAYVDGTPQEQAQKVNAVRLAKQINYRLLMGSDASTCPVKAQFAVYRFPTLVLLDETGRIIWRSEGLTREQVPELEAIIKQKLGVR